MIRPGADGAATEGWAIEDRAMADWALPVVPGGVVAAVVLLAVALQLGEGPIARARLRGLRTPPAVDGAAPRPLRPAWVAIGAVALGGFAWAVGGALAGVVVSAVAGAVGVVAMRRAPRSGPREASGSELAGRWELLAVCLESGMPVAPAVAAAADPLVGSAGTQLRRVAGLLELGADPLLAWRAAEDAPVLAAFARAAGRSSATGAALAQVARDESTRIRTELIDTAQARAQRAAVLITGPLGLCFLPAFLVLGIAPVVLGLAGEALAQW